MSVEPLTTVELRFSETSCSLCSIFHVGFFLFVGTSKQFCRMCLDNLIYFPQNSGYYDDSTKPDEMSNETDGSTQQLKTPDENIHINESHIHSNSHGDTNLHSNSCDPTALTNGTATDHNTTEGAAVDTAEQNCTINNNDVLTANSDIGNHGDGGSHLQQSINKENKNTEDMLLSTPSINSIRDNHDVEIDICDEKRNAKGKMRMKVMTWFD